MIFHYKTNDHTRKKWVDLRHIYTRLQVEYIILDMLQYLYFAHGETSQVISLQVLDDDTPEPDEELLVILDNPQGGALLGENTQGLSTEN